MKMKMQMIIKRQEPIPKAKSSRKDDVRNFVSAVKNLAPGDCVFVPNAHMAHKTAKKRGLVSLVYMVTVARQKTGYHLATRQTSENGQAGIGVWRIS